MVTVEFETTGYLAGVLCVRPRGYELKDYLKKRRFLKKLRFEYNRKRKEWRKDVNDMSEQELEKLLDRNIINNDTYDKIMIYRQNHFAYCRSRFEYKNSLIRGLTLKNCSKFEDVLKSLGFLEVIDTWWISLSDLNDTIVTTLFDNQIISKQMYIMLSDVVKYEEKQVGDVLVKMRKFKYVDLYQIPSQVNVVLLEIFKHDRSCFVYINGELLKDTFFTIATAKTEIMSVNNDLKWYANKQLQEYLNLSDDEVEYFKRFMEKYFVREREVKTQYELEKLEKEFAEITLDIDS